MTDSDLAHHEKSRAALASLGTAVVLTSIKLIVGFYTNSLGILSEALHSGFDLLAAALTFYAVRVASRPADEQHPYGHGKVENLAALAETALLLLTCGWIIGEAVERLFFKSTPVMPSLWGVGVMLVSIILDVHRVRLLRAVAKKHKSQALEADALHFSSDILSSSVVLVGLLCIWGGQYLPSQSPLHTWIASADAVAALLVSVIVLHSSYVLARKSINDLMDAGSAEVRERIEEAVGKLAGIGKVYAVRLRQSGPDSFVDLRIGVPSRMSVDGGHKLTQLVETTIQAIVPGADVVVHVEPTDGGNPLSILHDAAAAHDVAIHALQLVDTPQGLQIELHAEVPKELTLQEAHERVTAFEEKAMAELPGAVIVSHLEPLGATLREAVCPLPCTEEELSSIKQKVDDVMCALGGISGCHKLTAYRLDAGEGGALCLCFHCRMAGTSTVDAAHDASRRLEAALHRAIPELGRIVAHMEPEAE